MNNPIQIQFRISPDSRHPAVGIVDVVIANKTLATLEDYPVQQLADRFARRPIGTSPLAPQRHPQPAIKDPGPIPEPARC